MPSRPNAALSHLHMQIMRSRLIAVVEEQAQTLVLDPAERHLAVPLPDMA